MIGRFLDLIAEARAAKGRTQWKAILTYHSIDDSGSPISVSPETFRAHRAWLTSGRVRVVSLGDIFTHPFDGPDAVAVTFDDGLFNAAEAVTSLLSDGIPATVFAVTGLIGGTNTWGGRSQPGIPVQALMGWSDLERLAARGAGVEAHSRTHPFLTRLDSDALDEEMRGCADDLHMRLGVQATHFAYPYGDVDDRVATHAARHFRYGHTTQFGVLRGDVAVLRCPRLDMFYFNTPGAIESWGSPSFVRRLGWIRTRRAVRRRLARLWLR